MTPAAASSRLLLLLPAPCFLPTPPALSLSLPLQLLLRFGLAELRVCAPNVACDAVAAGIGIGIGSSIGIGNGGTFWPLD